MTTIQSDVKCEIVVPVELREHVEQFTKAYADTLVFEPFLSWGKVVMEQGSSSHAQAFVVRFLLQALYGKLPTTFDELKAIRETNRWENWMVTAHGSYVLGSDMSLSSTTLSVHRADGWEDVYDDVFNKGAARQPTDPLWPQPDGQATYNRMSFSRAYVDKMAADYPEVASRLADLIAAGAHVSDYEILVDVRNKQQRIAAYALTSAIDPATP